jgi:hypothetical protein
MLCIKASFNCPVSAQSEITKELGRNNLTHALRLLRYDRAEGGRDMIAIDQNGNAGQGLGRDRRKGGHRKELV